jgi:hypothetical protein
MSQKDFDVYDPMDDYDDRPSDEDMEHFKRGGRDIPRRYRHRDDEEYYAERRHFKKEYR